MTPQEREEEGRLQLKAGELIRLALIYAVQDRESFADACGRDTEDGREAWKMAKAFRAYHRRRFKDSHLNQLEADLSDATYVTLDELQKRHPL